MKELDRNISNGAYFNGEQNNFICLWFVISNQDSL